MTLQYYREVLALTMTSIQRLLAKEREHGFQNFVLTLRPYSIRDTVSWS